MLPSTMGLSVAQSHRPGFACALPKHASLPGFLPWAQLETDLRSSTGHSWRET